MTLPADHTLARRKQVRILLRRDLQIAPQQYEGKRYYVVKDPVRLRYFRFKEQEHFLMQRLDGVRTLAEIQEAFETQFRPRRLTLEEVELFIQQIIQSGLAHRVSSRAGKDLFDSGRRQRRASWLARGGNLLSIRVPLFDPDRLLERWLRYLGWIFTPWFALASGGMIVAALLLVAVHFDDFRARLPAAHEFFRWQTIAALWLLLGTVKIVHEFGHALSCKAFGGEVHEMGAMFLLLSPCMYCNVSDAWTLPNKRQRMLIGFAGIYVELLLAALAAFVWWNSPGPSLLSHSCLSLIAVCGVNSLLFNGNPLLRFDGYYILADALEIPNLAERSRHYFKRCFLETCLGMTLAREAYQPPWRRTLFLSYALASTLYRWLVTLGVLGVLYLFLEPYRLGSLAVLFAVVTAGSLLAGPYRWGRSLLKRGRFPEMKRSRMAVSAALLGSVVLAFLTVPLPLSRIRQTALLQVRPEALEQIFVQSPGILERLYVRDGQQVEKGDLLAEFRSLELETLLAEVRAEHDIRAVQIQALRERTSGIADPAERAGLEVQLTQQLGERSRAGRQREVYEQMRQRLQLRAPRAGVVLGLPRVDEIGRYWDRGLPTPFCSLGAPDRLWALLPLGPADYRLLRDDLDDATRLHGQLDVAIRLPGRAGHTWAGRVIQLPEAEAREVPLALTQRGGGPVPMKPAADGGHSTPQSQHYFVGVALLDPDEAVFPGTMAQVLIRCRWRTGAWWLRRCLSTTFDLGLLY